MTDKTRKALKYKEKEWLEQKHCEEKFSTREIAQKVGVDHKTVIYWLKKFDIPRNDRSDMSRLKIPKGPANHNYGKKGKLSASFGRKHTAEELAKMKGNSCGENNPMWKGGTCLHALGYIWIYAPKHPFANNHKYVLEHRLVMEKILGRYLQPNEIVHHINERKDDNRPENLMVFSSIRDHTKYHVYLKKMKAGVRNECNDTLGKISS